MVMLRGARACSGGALVEVWRCSVDSVDRKKEGEVRRGTLLHRNVEVLYRTCVPVPRARTSHHHYYDDTPKHHKYVPKTLNTGQKSKSMVKTNPNKSLRIPFIP